MRIRRRVLRVDHGRQSPAIFESPDKYLDRLAGWKSQIPKSTDLIPVSKLLQASGQARAGSLKRPAPAAPAQNPAQTLVPALALGLFFDETRDRALKSTQVAAKQRHKQQINVLIGTKSGSTGGIKHRAHSHNRQRQIALFA